MRRCIVGEDPGTRRTRTRGDEIGQSWKGPLSYHPRLSKENYV
jgi:hypothetical protein